MTPTRWPWVGTGSGGDPEDSLKAPCPLSQTWQEVLIAAEKDLTCGGPKQREDAFSFHPGEELRPQLF